MVITIKHNAQNHTEKFRHRLFAILFENAEPITQDEPIDLVLKYRHEKPTFIFKHLFDDKFAYVCEELASYFSVSCDVSISQACWHALTQELSTHLCRVLNGILHDNWLGFTNLLKENEIDIEEGEAKTLFLQQMSETGFQTLFETKPVLRIACHKIIDFTVANIEKFISRLTNDLNNISKFLDEENPEALRIKDLKLTLSDPHNGMQSVIIVEFEGGKHIVYKPRPLEVEHSLYRFISSLEEEGFPISLTAMRVLQRDDYGWMEHCQAITQLDDPYDHAMQLGAILVLWYILAGDDLHEENIIVTQDGPVIIDAETAFSCSESTGLSEQDSNQFFYPYVNTLHSTGIMTGYMALDEEDTFQNVGAVSLYDQIFTDHPDYDWGSFVDAFCEGVTSAIHFFSTPQQKERTEQSIRTMFDGCTVRIIARMTSSYFKILSFQSREYDSLKSENDLEECLKKILADFGVLHDIFDVDMLVKDECRQLMNFDVPHFQRKIGSTVQQHECISFNEGHVGDFDFVRKRLNRLNPEFLDEELSTIRGVLTPLEKTEDYYVSVFEDKHTIHKNVTYDAQQIFSFHKKEKIHETIDNIADKVFDSLCADGHEFKYGLRIYEDHNLPALFHYGPHLYSGLMGRIVFLAAYAKINHDTEKQDFLKNIAHSIEKNIISILQRRDCITWNGGVFSGIPSLIYSLYLLDQMGFIELKEETVLLWFENRNKGAQGKLDFIDGHSGIIQLLILLEQRFPSLPVDLVIGDFEVKCHEYITYWDDLEKDNNRIGLAHGSLGPAVALSSLYKRSQNETFKTMALKLLDMEEKARASTEDEAIGNSNLSWCYGVTGRTYAYFEIGKALEEQHYIDAAKDLIATREQYDRFLNHTFCCGSAGYLTMNTYINKESNLKIGKYEKMDHLHKFYENWNDRFFMREKEDTHQMELSLFKGISGAGYAFLYALYPHEIPEFWNINW